jgi:phosphoribosylglycinamide formyltransferase-1
VHKKRFSVQPKLLKKLMSAHQIAIFASGSGSNAENISTYFSTRNDVKIALIVTNNPSATVLKRAKRLGIESVTLTKEQLLNSQALLNLLSDKQIDFIVLAGYLLKIPAEVVKAYPGRIVNIHPALLPSYGGKGMYGHHVHEAVLAAGDKESGITIHLVDELYDNGSILFQARCPVYPTDTPETLAERVHALEYAHYPRVIDEQLKRLPPTDR